MTENAFTQAEAALVDKIVEGLRTINWYGNRTAALQYIESMASLGVRSYAGSSRYISALAVIQLVKEKLNAVA